ncbi:DHH family phosphoesterase [Vulcanisaeta sp. JCM 16161]|uniref:DHH family phosphoesterase n=1 Tax=Vulcanisaeta sp. JCM 16161 TaxID=1295372 RepID=UPI001FB25642|nr:DHH family phosphoesterase [Vulcanisaeta sp. JCM 16161]
MLRNTQKACVITHRHADMDAYACGVATKELINKLGYNAFLVIPEGPSREVKSFINKLGMNYQGLDNCDEANLAFLVDVSTYAQLNEFRSVIGDKPVVVIDHHEVRNIIPTVSLVDPSATSCSEIITQVFREFGFEPSVETAILLIGGILSDSGRLSRARPETFEHWPGYLGWRVGIIGILSMQ